MSARKPAGRQRAGRTPAGGNSRKALQLCGQVARTVEAVLVGELDDEHLRELIVHSVKPAPDETHLLVTVGPFAPGVHLDPALVMQRLHAASARIRAEVASAITRKRTPALTYLYAEPPQMEHAGP